MADGKSVIQMAHDAGVEFIDVKFTGLLGDMQHLTFPVEAQLNEGFFEDGVGFDGSSVRGFQTIDKSDMLLMLDPTSAFVDPVLRVPTLSVIGDVYDPVSGYSYERDPRQIAQPAEEYLTKTKVATTSSWGHAGGVLLFNPPRFL